MIAVKADALNVEIGGGGEDFQGAGIGGDFGVEIDAALRGEGAELDLVGVAFLEGAHVELADLHFLFASAGSALEGDHGVHDLAMGGFAVDGDLGVGFDFDAGGQLGEDGKGGDEEQGEEGTERTERTVEKDG